MLTQNTLRQIVRLMERGIFDKARQSLKSLIDRQPNNADAWQLLAACEKNLGKTEEAVYAFNKSLSLQPAQAHTWNNLANLHLQCREYEQASSAYRKALQFHPGYDNARLNLALALTECENYSEALRHLLDLQVKHPHNSKILLGIGDCLRLQGMTDKAMSAYERALASASDQFLPLFKIGLTCKTARQWQKSREFFQKSLKLNSASTAALHNLASVEAAVGNLQKAVELYRRCVQLEPENPNHHLWLSKLLWLCADPDFLGSYEELPESVRYRPEFLLEKCRYLRLAGEPQKAEAELDAAISRGYSSPEILAELSAAYRSSGKISASIALLEQPIGQERTYSLNDELGRAYLQGGEFIKCRKLYEDLLKTFPNNQGFWCMYATALQQLEDPMAAELLDYGRLVHAVKIPAPKGFSNIGEFNRALSGHLEKMHIAKREPIDQSLSGGTQTLNDLFDSDSPLIQRLKQNFRTAILEHIAGLTPIKGHPFLDQLPKDIDFSGSWSVSLNRNGYHRSHFHTQGWLSSAYYVKIPRDVDENGEGWIEFGKPAFSVPGKEHADYMIKPEEGLLVLFPSYMWHGTRPFTSSAHRLTIAFDAVHGLMSPR